ncbi:hypothetical protein Ae406Ps2_5222 [Pseudonocardia sp. Ae406_Ps2]|uniref:DUF4232 domain-containing protein n=1 Tax=unclassified Pseudonocardia TaxID=2619320 RepID=UPI00094AFA55|nr:MULTISPECIES: DUF4232 domain-containing protein [unclassified Pseudonocardia]OLL97071.1 hypothetical protein Ae331Ps2_0738c [Pseudonocardia sp. Ae331_Ps2]OLM05222.1 hypothetical protein Ae406Ps2_5222 [Pseudonocardia sp. Ae406_Ps2]OLM26790.1 hypothetical protein Ae706Ps2_5223 [Pseudonocardia sp. Ae706_Ps2]
MTTHRAPLLIGLLSAGLLVAGCGGAAEPANQAPAALSSPPTTAAQQPTGEAGQVARCTSQSLEASVGTTLGNDQKDTTIVWRNTSAAPCTMTGFGGVDLRGPDDPQWGPSYSLPRGGGADHARREAGRHRAHRHHLAARGQLDADRDRRDRAGRDHVDDAEVGPGSGAPPGRRDPPRHLHPPGGARLGVTGASPPCG